MGMSIGLMLGTVLGMVGMGLINRQRNKKKTSYWKELAQSYRKETVGVNKDNIKLNDQNTALKKDLHTIVETFKTLDQKLNTINL